jgi:hypothetical protein
MNLFMKADILYQADLIKYIYPMVRIWKNTFIANRRNCYRNIDLRA